MSTRTSLALNILQSDQDKFSDKKDHLLILARLLINDLFAGFIFCSKEDTLILHVASPQNKLSVLGKKSKNALLKVDQDAGQDP